MGHPYHLKRLYTKIALDTYGPFPVTCRCGGLVHGFGSDDGCVHHKDEDPYNNVPENLEIIHHACHTSHHKTGFHHTEEAKARISDTMKGREFTDEHRDNLSKALTGRQFTDEWRENIGNASRGRTASAETRQKMSEARQGTQMSDEAKRKISEAHKGKLIGAALMQSKCLTCGKIGARGPMGNHAKRKNHEVIPV